MWVDKVNNMKETITPCVKILNKKEQAKNPTKQTLKRTIKNMLHFGIGVFVKK
jgi:hypothetical protein